MGVLCRVLWLRVGEVSGLRVGDVSLPLWLRFCNSEAGKEGWHSRPLSLWADGFPEALLRWAEAKGGARGLTTPCSLISLGPALSPCACKVNPDILLNGLGPVGSHVIPQDIRDQTVPRDFYGQGLRDFDVETPWVDVPGNERPGAPSGVSDEVSKLVTVLKRQWLLYDLSDDLSPTCWPFIIPKTSEKLSLILSSVKQNGMDGYTPPPRFSLRSWEQLSKQLVTFYPGVPLYGMRIDLKNAFWSFVLRESARTIFRLRSGRSGRVVGLGRLPFG